MEFVVDSIYKGDCREILKEWSDNCIDSIVTDPPYGLAFMGKGWDRGVPGCEFWAEALRVAKPGAHLFAFGGTRTYHRLACAIEDAGWQIRDCLGWIYGSGFPKSLDVSKAIDKAAGAERERIGDYGQGFRAKGSGLEGWQREAHSVDKGITAPATEAARQWQGWGTALKPAWEPIILARKPFIGTVANNVLEHGTGGLNVDGCRIGTDSTTTIRSGNSGANGRYGKDTRVFTRENPPGRWPANIIHDGSDEVEALFPCSVSGSASRFFYCAKASRSERGEGNHHPTVKPLRLMRYLCRLVTPPNGIVLDMFAGSGSTLVAACLERFAFAGCELSPEYAEIARSRVAAAQEIVARSQGKNVQQVLDL